MSIARINATKGDTETFERLAKAVRHASRDSGRECRILFDLGGPNPRTLLFENVKAPKNSWRATASASRGTRRAAERLQARGIRSVIGSSLPEVLDDLRPGEHVSYDDGKVNGMVCAVDADGAVISVRQVIGDRARSKADKTLNFPDTQPRPALAHPEGFARPRLRRRERRHDRQPRSCAARRTWRRSSASSIDAEPSGSVWC